MRIGGVFCTLLIFFLLAFNGALGAEGTPKHVEAFNNYNQSLESGDAVAVDRYAKEAWLAAEDELGDNQTTAILAYNYANWIYENDPAAAIKPIKRVIALTGPSNEMFGADFPILILRYCEAMVASDKKRSFTKLREFLKQREEKGLQSSLVAARAWRAVALHDMERMNFGYVEMAAAHAERHFKEAAPQMERNLAEVLVLQGTAFASGKYRRRKDLQNSITYFDRAIALFPPQNSIDDFDQLLAVALAWRHAVVSIAVLEKKSAYTRAASDALKYVKRNKSVEVVWASGFNQSDCEMEWDKRKRPQDPQKTLNRYALGVVLVGYNLSEEGWVVDARVLAEVPGRSQFGESSLEAVRTWKLTKPAPNECRQNIISTFNYVIR